MATRSSIKRFTILGFGWAFVLLGAAGLFLPFLQGILFLLVGLYLLSLESPRARLFRQRLRKRYPSLARKSDEAAKWMHRQRDRLLGRS